MVFLQDFIAKTSLEHTIFIVKKTIQTQRQDTSFSPRQIWSYTYLSSTIGIQKYLLTSDFFYMEQNQKSNCLCRDIDKKEEVIVYMEGDIFYHVLFLVIVFESK